MASAKAESLIEIRVDELAQLFHTLDPFPFREKDLDQQAEDYIVSWAREIPGGRPIRIVVYSLRSDPSAKVSEDLNEASKRYFAGRVLAVQHELNELFRVGRRSLAIGISVLVACLLSAHLISEYQIDSRSKSWSRRAC